MLTSYIWIKNGRGKDETEGRNVQMIEIKVRGTFSGKVDK